MTVDEVLEEPAETEEAPAIPQTLQIHKVERTHDNHNVFFFFTKLRPIMIPCLNNTTETMRIPKFVIIKLPV